MSCTAKSTLNIWGEELWDSLMFPFYFNSCLQIWNTIGYYGCYIWPRIKFKWDEKNKYYHLLLWPSRILFHYLLSIWVVFKLETMTYMYIVTYSMLLRHIATENKSFDSQGSCSYMILAKLFGLLRLHSLINWTKSLYNNSKSFSRGI